MVHCLLKNSQGRSTSPASPEDDWFGFFSQTSEMTIGNGTEMIAIDSHSEGGPYNPEEWRPFDSTDEISLSSSGSMDQPQLDEVSEVGRECDQHSERRLSFFGERRIPKPPNMYECEDVGMVLRFDEDLKDWIHVPVESWDVDLGIPSGLEEYGESCM